MSCVCDVTSILPHDRTYSCKGSSPAVQYNTIYRTIRPYKRTLFTSHKAPSAGRA